MTNPFINALEDVGKVLAWPFVHVARVISILTVTLKDYPAVRVAVVGLVSQVETVAADVATAAAQGELNAASDAAELAAALALFNYVKTTFLPAIEAAYNDEVSAATATSTAAAAAAQARSAAAVKAALTKAAKAAASTDTASSTVNAQA